MSRFEKWIVGWASLIAGLIAIITFGYVLTPFSYNVVMRQTEHRIARRQRKYQGTK